MTSQQHNKKYYQAFIDKNSNYEGVFYVGVKTTGVFCHPTCSARKPKFENCEFYKNSQQAIKAGFRPCKRCCPLSHPHQVSTLVQTLVETVELHPEKRWKENDFRELSVDASTVRRQFKKRFGMTFAQYARMRRMDLALQKMQAGAAVIQAQLAAGYESSSGFREAFSRLLGKAPALLDNKHYLKASWLDTPLGPMIAIANEEVLYLLEFADYKGLEQKIEHLKRKTAALIIPGEASPIHAIKIELELYFSGKSKKFKTPIVLLGSSFQNQVWKELMRIPYGQTKSYAEIAGGIGIPTAYRAAAQANGANQFVIIVPCHRVINTNGKLGGYSSGLTRKIWLLNHEKQGR
jgi:AraC family transcriptional regulator of adaptative response/methylated-DNA-[protein]-cysteine methyltransferase